MSALSTIDWSLHAEILIDCFLIIGQVNALPMIVFIVISSLMPEAEEWMPLQDLLLLDGKRFPYCLWDSSGSQLTAPNQWMSHWASDLINWKAYWLNKCWFNSINSNSSRRFPSCLCKFLGSSADGCGPGWGNKLSTQRVFHVWNNPNSGQAVCPHNALALRQHEEPDRPNWVGNLFILAEMMSWTVSLDTDVFVPRTSIMVCSVPQGNITHNHQSQPTLVTTSHLMLLGQADQPPLVMSRGSERTENSLIMNNS